jgi:para-aminobenzoate synthetase component 1
LGGCFGYFGYELKTFIEPRLGRRADVDLQLADCDIGFYDSLLVFDHLLDRSWIISTGFQSGGTRSGEQAREQVAFWRCALERDPGEEPLAAGAGEVPAHLPSSLSRPEFVARVKRAQDYIRAGDVYQVNLSHRFSAPFAGTGWDLFSRLNAVSPAPHAAFLKAMDSCLVSASPELFLRWSGRQVQTRPIKGTRPRSADAERDAQLAFELLTSPKENAELVMITDLLRNDLGKVCEFGSVRVPELARLERFPHVQHLVSTVEGRLRPGVSHLQALAACFPGGSITGAPKVRAMEIIDELEPVARGPYTGALGYLGFNQESQLSILIRSAVLKNGVAFFNVGAGIVADSDPEAEYEETVAKAAGMISALRAGARRNPTSPNPWPAF